MDKFGCCNSCVHNEDNMVCDECEDADGYEFDESLIEIAPDGRMQIRQAFLMAA